MTAEEAEERFFNELYQLGEKTRRQYAHEGRLPNEAHEVHTTYSAVAELKCKHCYETTRFQHPVRPLPGEASVKIECVHCGDLTIIRFWTPGAFSL